LLAAEAAFKGICLLSISAFGYRKCILALLAKKAIEVSRQTSFPRLILLLKLFYVDWLEENMGELEIIY
jgi:hypothetical protein